MAILTKYIPASNTKGSRAQVTMENGKRYTVSLDPGLSHWRAHAAAVVEALEKHYTGVDSKWGFGHFVVCTMPDKTPYSLVFIQTKSNCRMKITRAYFGEVLFPVPKPK